MQAYASNSNKQHAKKARARAYTRTQTRAPVAALDELDRHELVRLRVARELHKPKRPRREVGHLDVARRLLQRVGVLLWSDAGHGCWLLLLLLLLRPCVWGA
jgi:hypothetical protein